MKREGGVLALFAHPDDESLLAGGTLAACASAGREVALVSMTRGEEGPIGDPAVSRERLGEVRHRELRAAARELGAASARCLDYPDGQLESQPEQRVAAELAALIADARPAMILSFGPEGFYWHEDHVAVHRFARVALEQVACDPPPELYEATWPEGRMTTLVAEMVSRGRPTDLWGLQPAAFGAPAGSIDLELDVTSFLAPKLRALRCHRSQLATGHLLADLPDDLAERFLGTEYFMAEHGPGTLPGVIDDALRARAARQR
jgi:LmbE family N-acetylglucosaminyl deacetylase